MACIHRGVSFCSFLYELYRGDMTLEDCFRETAAAGIKGIEILADYMIPGYPNISNEFVDEWHTLLKKYDITPVCMGLFNTANPVGNVDMSTNEMVVTLKQDLHIAFRLGFSSVRISADTPVEVTEAALPEAEKVRVKMGYEIHPPLSMDSQWFAERLNMIQRSRTEYVGFIPDMGIFAEYANPIQREWYIRRGVRRPVADAICRLYAERKSKEEAKAVLAEYEISSLEKDYMGDVFRSNNENPDNILKYKDYFYHFHGKFYEMDDSCHETSLNYEEVMKKLVNTDYEGFICSEYEGSRHLSDIMTVESCEQVRRHQVMLKKYSGNLTG